MDASPRSRDLHPVLCCLTSGALILAFAGCSRDSHTLPMVPPYTDDAEGVITASWNNIGEERAFSGGARLKEPEVRFRYRLDARNDSDEKLFARLAEMQLVDRQGLALASDPARIECTLNSGETPGVLVGELWVPKSNAEAVHGFHVSRFAVPLGTRGVERYREWLLQGRPSQTAQVDAEIAQLAAAPPCAAR